MKAANFDGPGPPKAPKRIALPWYRNAIEQAMRMNNSAAFIHKGISHIARMRRAVMVDKLNQFFRPDFYLDESRLLTFKACNKQAKISSVFLDVDVG